MPLSVSAKRARQRGDSARPRAYAGRRNASSHERARLRDDAVAASTVAMASAMRGSASLGRPRPPKRVCSQTTTASASPAAGREVYAA